MSGICLPIDASAGSPSFPAAQHRAAQSALSLSAPGRPLGARSGIRPGATPSVSLAGSNWTLTPFSAVVDPGTGLAVGPYLVAFLANETGTLNPADGTNPRVDRLDVQVPDDPPGASPRTAVIVYTAGVPAASPSAPAAPARSFPLGTFSVPKATTGNPSWSPAMQLTVASGGILPVTSVAAYGNGLYVGQVVDDATFGGLQRWTGGAWQAIIPGAWTVYTPKLTNAANSATVYASTNNNSRYMILGKTVFVQGDVTANAATSGGVAVDLPFASKARLLNCGSLGAFGTSTPADQCGIALMAADLARLLLVAYTGGFRDVASGNIVRWSATYELP